jgi:hypothetical protein
MEVCVEREIAGCEFPDERLKSRFGKLLGQLSKKIGVASPTACQNGAATRRPIDSSITLASMKASCWPGISQRPSHTWRLEKRPTSMRFPASYARNFSDAPKRPQNNQDKLNSLFACIDGYKTDFLRYANGIRFSIFP